MSKNIYDGYTDEQLREGLKESQDYVKWSRNLVSMQGGWIMWDGDQQDRAEKSVSDITRELNMRKAAQLNKEVYT